MFGLVHKWGVSVKGLMDEGLSAVARYNNPSSVFGICALVVFRGAVVIVMRGGVPQREECPTRS